MVHVSIEQDFGWKPFGAPFTFQASVRVDFDVVLRQEVFVGEKRGGFILVQDVMSTAGYWAEIEVGAVLGLAPRLVALDQKRLLRGCPLGAPLPGMTLFVVSFQ